VPIVVVSMLVAAGTPSIPDREGQHTCGVGSLDRDVVPNERRHQASRAKLLRDTARDDLKRDPRLLRAVVEENVPAIRRVSIA